MRLELDRGSSRRDARTKRRSREAGGLDGECRPHPLRVLERPSDVGVDQQDDELLSAHPAAEVALAGLFPEDLTEPNQDLVAGVVPELVVDRLEVIDVEGDEADWRVVATGAGQLRSGSLDESAAVEQAGETVDASFPGEPLHHGLVAPRE